MRTTGIQVSGYGFLLRRLELALVIGDPRMAHDPLRSQRRAIIVGVLISLLIAGGAVMLGLLRPQPNIGDAQLVADESGTLHVRLEDAFHPVTNVASARLVLRQPVEIQQSTAQQLAEHPHGEPMGIPLVPGLVEAPKRELLYCEPGVVFASESVRWHRHAVVRAPSGTWLVVGKERFLIDANAPRGLGINAIDVSDSMVGQLERRADVRMPRGHTGLPAPFEIAGRVLLAGERAFMAAPGGVAELRGPQRAVAEALSPVPAIHVNVAEVVAQPGVDVLTGVPTEDVEWSAPERICVGTEGLGTPVELDTDKGAERGADLEEIGRLRDPELGAYEGPSFIGPRGTTAVATERGILLVTDTGRRFSVGSQEDLTALGFGEPQPASWRVVSVLPDSGLLSEANARATNATMSTVETNNASAMGTE